MNCLLQQPMTGLFLAPDFSWTEDEAEALRFEDQASALRFCARYAVGPVQVVAGWG